MQLQSCSNLETERGNLLRFGMSESGPEDNVFFPRLVHLYREALTLERRLEIANLIYQEIHRDLRLYLMSRVHPNSVEDVLNESLKAIFSSLDAFRGNSNPEFYKWCYRIARNKKVDTDRKDRFETLPTEEFWELVESTNDKQPLSSGDRHDFEYVLKLLKELKPKCRELLLDHFFFGFSLVELGEQLKLKYAAVRQRIQRCLQSVRGLIE